MRPRTVLLTGATGLIGGGVLRRLLRRDVRIDALLRRPESWRPLAATLGDGATRVTPLFGDITVAGLGLSRAARERIARADVVVHCAADTSFSRPLVEARAVNVAGSAHLLELVGETLERFVYVSTAFVAGARTGVVREHEPGGGGGFVNAYEQSKHEAELLLRASGVPHVVLRPSTVVCDDASGAVTQYNAVHRALRVFHAGLAALLPGSADVPVDVVTTEHVVNGVIDIGFAPHANGHSYQLCAGAGALPLGEMLERTHAIWSRDSQWRRRGVSVPALTDLGTYRLFERSVAEIGDVRLTTITRSLSHFAPQLALPKQFDTSAADALLGRSAPPVRSFWDALVEHLAATRWGLRERSAA